MYLLYLPLTVTSAVLDFLFGTKDWRFIPTHDPRNGLVKQQMITVQVGRCTYCRSRIWWLWKTVGFPFIKPPVGFKVSLRNRVLGKHIDTYHQGDVTVERLNWIVDFNNATNG